MTARNDITGDAIATGSTTENYRTGWDRIFGKKPAQKQKETDDVNPPQDSNRSDQGETPSAQ